MSLTDVTSGICHCFQVLECKVLRQKFFSPLLCARYSALKHVEEERKNEGDTLQDCLVLYISLEPDVIQGMGTSH